MRHTDLEDSRGQRRAIPIVSEWRGAPPGWNRSTRAPPHCLREDRRHGPGTGHRERPKTRRTRRRRWRPPAAWWDRGGSKTPPAAATSAAPVGSTNGIGSSDRSFGSGSFEPPIASVLLASIVDRGKLILPAPVAVRELESERVIRVQQIGGQRDLRLHIRAGRESQRPQPSAVQPQQQRAVTRHPRRVAKARASRW